jgi:hypothetical protein
MACLTEIPVTTILLGLESSHQALKRRYLSEFGTGGLGSQNNGKTLQWLKVLKRQGDLRDMTVAIRSLARVLRDSGDLSMNYGLIRQVYAVSPSLHEVWFFDGHLQHNFRQLFANRLGFKAYLTSKAKGTLARSLQGIATTVLRQALLLENMTCSQLSISLMDDSVAPSSDIDKDIRSVLEELRHLRVTTGQIVAYVPRIFAIVRGLLELTDFREIRSGALVRGWMRYAPCAINCGPIFDRKTDSSILDVLGSLPDLSESRVRSHIREHFDVSEILPGERPLSLA